MVKVAVMGAGSWGTTLAKVFADNGNSVTLWARRSELVNTMKSTHRNPDYLPEIDLPSSISLTHDAPLALQDAEIVVVAVPSQTVRENVVEWKKYFPPHATLVSIAKGIEQNTLYRMSQVLQEVSGLSADHIVVLSGPNLAKEIAASQPAATVIAGSDPERLKAVQTAIGAPYFRPYTNTDVIGVELGGACKNVIALACGIASGIGLGENTAATLITRGLAEITRLGVAMGADSRTFAGLAGLGDLVATCSSPLSRNRSFGHRLGQGGTIQDALDATHGQVAEGVISSKSIYQLAQQHGVEMPITQAVYLVSHKNMDVTEMIVALMGRTKKAE